MVRIDNTGMGGANNQPGQPVAALGMRRKGDITSAVNAVVRQFIPEAHLLGARQEMQGADRPFEVALVEPSDQIMLVANAVRSGGAAREEKPGRLDPAR